MKYALGNMLNGAGGLNPDGLALDLQFAADKTLTARRGPTPVLTRGSGATFVNSAGLIEYAPENLLLQSAGFSTGSWTKSGSTVTADSIASPDGTVTADLLNEDSGLSAHFAQQTVSASLNAGQAYTFSVFAKAGSHTSFQMTVSTLAFGSNLFANFVLTGAGSVGASNGVNTNIQSYDNGWYRCSITISSVGGGANGICIIASNNNNSSAARTPSYQGTGAQVVYLWGAQLETASTARTYNPTTTAAFYGPRFDHDPVTLASRGLLIEESRTNLVFPSDTLTTQTRTVTATAHTLSFYGTGTVVLSGTHVATVVGAGAYPTRTTLTFTPTAGSLTLTVTGSVTQAQLEVGPFATSYIPTTTASLARSADVCNITGANFTNLWNASGGTFLFEGFLIPSTNINLRMLSSGSSRRWLYGNQAGAGTVVETLALFDGTNTPPYFTNVRIAVKFKIAISVEALTCKASFNGSAISTVSHNGNLLTSVTLLGLFESASGYIASVKYYKKNLPNAKLQAITV